MGDSLLSKLQTSRSALTGNSSSDQKRKTSVFYDQGEVGDGERVSSIHWKELEDQSVSGEASLCSMDSDGSSQMETSPKPEKKRPSIIQSQLIEMLLKNQQLAQTLANVEDGSDGSQSPDETVEDTVSQDDGEKNSGGVKDEKHSSREYVGSDFVDVAAEETSEIDFEGDTFFERIIARIAGFGVEILDALSETNEDLKEQDEGLKPLNVRELRRNSKRCTTESRPYLEMMAGVQDILHWKVPLSTFTLFVVYMYCVWKGLLLSLVMFLILLQLILNYLCYRRNICLGISFLPRKEVESLKLDAPGAQLVVDISRRAQTFLEVASDVLEKIKHLFLWERPEMTLRFVLIVSFWFCLSLLTSMSTFLTIVGFGVGIKLFITTYLFYRFPRLSQKLDVVVWFLDRLPTNKKAQYKRKLSEKNYSVASALHSFAEFGEMAAFSDSSQASALEAPKIIRKCVLVDREISFPYAVGSGSLYVTDSHILFKYRRASKGRREIVKMPFDEILAVIKAKAIKSSFIPVSGKALEIFVPGRSKPYLLIGIVRRDECFENIMSLGKMYGPKAQFAK